MSDLCDDKADKCAPGIYHEAGSCIDTEIIISMAKAWNKYAETKGLAIIELMTENSEMINMKKVRHYYLSELRKKFSDKCSTDQCIAERPELLRYLTDKEKIILEKFTWRPEGPSGKFEWLSTTNIDDVMRQYERKYKNFIFLGAVPIDFDNINVGLKDLNLDNLLKEGKTKIGIVFNLDEHYKSGSHWVAGFIDLISGDIFYFDSYGYPPELRIRKLYSRIYDYMIGKGLTPNPQYNKIRHQYKGSECGIYSINIIVRLLRGESFDEISASRIPDDKVHKCRSVYFVNVL